MQLSSQLSSAARAWRQSLIELATTRNNDFFVLKTLVVNSHKFPAEVVKQEYVRISLDSKVIELKEILSQKEGVSVETIEIYFAGRRIAGEAPLRHHGIQYFDRVYVSFVSHDQILPDDDLYSLRKQHYSAVECLSNLLEEGELCYASIWQSMWTIHSTLGLLDVDAEQSKQRTLRILMLCHKLVRMCGNSNEEVALNLAVADILAWLTYRFGPLHVGDGSYVSKIQSLVQNIADRKREVLVVAASWVYGWGSLTNPELGEQLAPYFIAKLEESELYEVKELIAGALHRASNGLFDTGRPDAAARIMLYGAAGCLRQAKNGSSTRLASNMFTKGRTFLEVAEGVAEVLNLDLSDFEKLSLRAEKTVGSLLTFRSLTIALGLSTFVTTIVARWPMLIVETSISFLIGYSVFVISYLTSLFYAASTGRASFPQSTSYRRWVLLQYMGLLVAPIVISFVSGSSYSSLSHSLPWYLVAHVYIVFIMWVLLVHGDSPEALPFRGPIYTKTPIWRSPVGVVSKLGGAVLESSSVNFRDDIGRHLVWSIPEIRANLRTPDFVTNVLPSILLIYSFPTLLVLSLPVSNIFERPDLLFTGGLLLLGIISVNALLVGTRKFDTVNAIRVAVISIVALIPGTVLALSPILDAYAKASGIKFLENAVVTQTAAVGLIYYLAAFFPGKMATERFKHERMRALAFLLDFADEIAEDTNESPHEIRKLGRSKNILKRRMDSISALPDNPIPPGISVAASVMLTQLLLVIRKTGLIF